MLAKATATAVGIPMIYCSGSDFVELFVGRGAARVRNLFQRAERMAPCILFIDEIDALAKARDTNTNSPFGGGNGMRGNDEAEQTLNQLLTCMDGLDSSKQVCVLAATNRQAVLDPALLRPGRLDRLVSLTLPNSQGRLAILRVHAAKLPGFVEGTGVDPSRPNALGVGPAVDLAALAAIAQGCSGADLALLCNEAALRAVRRVTTAIRENRETITHVCAEDFEGAWADFAASRKPKLGWKWN